MATPQRTPEPPGGGARTLRCFITADLREVLPQPEDAAFLARLQRAMQDRFGPGAGAVLDYSELELAGTTTSPHRIEGGPEPGAADLELARDLVILAFNRLDC